MLEPGNLIQRSSIPVSVPGPDGLNIPETSGRAFLACDGKAMVVVELNRLEEVAVAPTAGEPELIWCNSQEDRLYSAIGSPGVVSVNDSGKLMLHEEIEMEEGVCTLTPSIWDSGSCTTSSLRPTVRRSIMKGRA